MCCLKFDKPREKNVTANKEAGGEAAVSMVSSHQPSFSYKKLLALITLTQTCCVLF